VREEAASVKKAGTGCGEDRMREVKPSEMVDLGPKRCTVRPSADDGAHVGTFRKWAHQRSAQERTSAEAEDAAPQTDMAPVADVAPLDQRASLPLAESNPVAATAPHGEELSLTAEMSLSPATAGEDTEEAHNSDDLSSIGSSVHWRDNESAATHWRENPLGTAAEEGTVSSGCPSPIKRMTSHQNPSPLMTSINNPLACSAGKGTAAGPRHPDDDGASDRQPAWSSSAGVS
jgi:hypothetical protein